jgi:heme/copper-type cytochrome/quinol oxidase subunit 4
MKILKFICGIIVAILIFMVYLHMNPKAEADLKNGDKTLNTIMNIIVLENILLLLYFWGTLNED